MVKRKSDTTIPVRTTAELKQEADKVLKSLGITLSDGVNLFLRQVVADQGLPFQPKLAQQAKLREGAQ
jgi:DNA-damage-inducible protein J